MPWGISSQLNTSKVMRLQKKAIRIMARLGYSEPCRPFFKQMNLLTVIGLYILEILTFVKSNMHNIKQDPVNHSYCTRNRHRFISPISHSTAIYEKSVSYSELSLYNMLPFDMQSASENEFKKRLKSFLVENPFYDIREFYDCDKSAM
jgi:hypothetical protein